MASFPGGGDEREVIRSRARRADDRPTSRQPNKVPSMRTPPVKYYVLRIPAAPQRRTTTGGYDDDDDDDAAAAAASALRAGAKHREPE